MGLTQRELELIGMPDVDLVAHTYGLANRCQTEEVMDELFSALCEVFERFAPDAAWEDCTNSIEQAFGDDIHGCQREFVRARDAARKRHAARIIKRALE